MTNDGLVSPVYKPKKENKNQLIAEDSSLTSASNTASIIQYPFVKQPYQELELMRNSLEITRANKMNIQDYRTY